MTAPSQGSRSEISVWRKKEWKQAKGQKPCRCNSAPRKRPCRPSRTVRGRDKGQSGTSRGPPGRKPDRVACSHSSPPEGDKWMLRAGKRPATAKRRKRRVRAISWKWVHGSEFMKEFPIFRLVLVIVIEKPITSTITSTSTRKKIAGLRDKLFIRASARQEIKGLASCSVLGVFEPGANAPPPANALDINFNGEGFAMVRPLFVHFGVFRQHANMGLGPFLEAGFAILFGGAEHDLTRVWEQFFAHPLGRGVEAAKQIKSPNESFEGRAKVGKAREAAASRLAAPIENHGAEFDFLGAKAKRAARDGRGLRLREPPFVKMPEFLIDRLRNDQADYGVTQKLQALIVAIRLGPRRPRTDASRLDPPNPLRARGWETPPSSQTPRFAGGGRCPCRSTILFAERYCNYARQSPASSRPRRSLRLCGADWGRNPGGQSGSGVS